MENDIRHIDAYLTDWDCFAQGEDDLAPMLQQAEPHFEKTLAGLLARGDKRAPARLVFYAVVQVGGYVETDTELGRAALSVLGAGFPLTHEEDGSESLFAADLYHWWKANRANFDSYPLLDNWLTGEFAASSVIPMYESLREG